MIHRVARRYLQGAVVTAGGSRTLYHIGKRPGSPKPKTQRKGWEPEPRRGEKWDRPWLDESVKSGVFLTDDPVQASMKHMLSGNVYAYEVPNWVIKESGGLHRYDWAREVLIPEKLWEHVKFKGKSMDKKELGERITKEKPWVKDPHKAGPRPPESPQEKKHTKREEKAFEQWASKMRYPNPLPRWEAREKRITFRTLKEHTRSRDPAVRQKAQAQIAKLKQTWESQREAA